jgi:RHS repeat-associated protein
MDLSQRREYIRSMPKTSSLSLILSLLSVLAGQAFAQDSLYPITSQPDPRLGASLTTPNVGVVNAPKIAGAPLSPLPIQMEPDPFTGGLTVKMHLAMPLAKGRSVPDLTLAYHSQHAYGSVGVGWGFSAGSIARNSGRGIDYSSKDFVISLGSASAELVNVKDDLYRDKQGDLRIEAQYNPANDSWMVFDPFGTKYAFGSTEGSRLSGANGTVQWGLDRVEDLTGNYSDLTYSTTAGALNLTGLLFSGNSRSELQPRNKVDIVYEAQPPKATATSFVGGVRVTNSVRIHQINITANGRPYANYNLKYQSSEETGRSLLVAVTREAGLRSSSVNFSYSDNITSNSTYSDNTGFSSEWYEYPVKSKDWSRAVVTGPKSSDTIYTQCLMGDFDGDGKADLACATDTSGQWQMGISKGSLDSIGGNQINQKYDGFNVSVWPGPAVKKQIQVDVPSWPNMGLAPDEKRTIADVRSTCLVGDFNGDSRTDIACYNSSDGSWNVGLSNGHGFDVAVWRNGPVLAGGAGGNVPLTDRCLFGDFDGDGKTDIACLVSSTAVSDEGKWSVALSTGKGWKTSTWVGSSPTGASEPVSGACIAADFNGDRRQDIACYSATDHVWHVALSRGTMFHSSAWANGPAITGDLGPQAVVPSRCVLGDFNGDGNADIACYTGTSASDEFNGKWSMGFSTGSGWSTVEWLGPPVKTSRKEGLVIANQCIAGDFNGDGRTDIACNYGAESKESIAYGKAFGDCPDKDLAQRNAKGCTFVPIWAESLSTGSGFTSSLFTPNNSVFATRTKFKSRAGCVAGDFTGDGKSDLLCDNSKDVFVLDISDFRPTDVITDIKNPLGLTGHFSYGFSSFEKDTKLGFSLPVLKRSVFSDGRTDTATSYVYSGGAYFKTGNRFRGFRQVRVAHDTDIAGRQLLETLWFHQGDGLAPDQGSASDENGLTVGKLYRRTLEDRQERALLNTLLDYQLEPTTVANDKAPRLVRETTEIDGSTGPVKKTTGLSYDEAGNISDVVVGYGSDGLEIHEHFTYSSDNQAHAFGYPLLDEVSDNQFGMLKQTTYSYDTGACDKPAPSIHLWQLTEVKRWIDADTSAEERLSRSPSGNVTCSEDALGNRTVSVFDAQDEYLSKITNPLNQTETFSYYGVDSESLGANAGLLSSTSNISGDTTQFFYDEFGRLKEVINADSSRMNVSYDDFGDPAKQSISSESLVGLTTKESVDGYGRHYLFRQSAPQGKAVGFAISYDQNGQLVRIGSPAVMPTLSDKPSGTDVEYEIERDELGRALSLQDARGALSRSCYDGLRVAKLDANGSGWIDTFDIFGNHVSTEEYAQKFDDCERLLQFHPLSPHADFPNGTSDIINTSYRYDGLNRLREVTRQGKVLTSITYDGLDNVTLVKNVDRGTSRYSYDRFGRLKRWQSDLDRAIEFNRDTLGRVIEAFGVGQHGEHSSLETYSYDSGDHAAGRLTYSRAGKVETNLFYNVMGRVVRQVNRVDGHDFNLTLNYDGAGRIDSIEYPDGEQIQYKYDASLLSSIEWEKSALVKLQDFNGYLEPTRLLFGNGDREIRTYGNSVSSSTVADKSCQSVPASYLCSISAISSAGGEDLKLLYHYDPIANVVGIDDATVGGTSFSYDRFDRLTAETQAPSSRPSKVDYAYDEIGRRVSVSGEGEYQYRNHADTAFSAPSQVGSTSIGYDGGGRRQTYGDERYEFDSFGRLAAAKIPAHDASIRYDYDAFGNLISSKIDTNHRAEVRYFVSDYAECAYTPKDSAVRCRDLIYGPAGLAAALPSRGDAFGLRRDPEYYHLDRNGTVRSITDQNGAIIAKLSYSAFGSPELGGSTQNEPSRNDRSLSQYYYAGHRWDADSGLYYFGTRFYDPRIGQFLSPDADAIVASGGINTYTYARNNPNRWTDPDGQQDVGGPGDYGASISFSIDIGGISPNLSGFSGDPSLSFSPIGSFNFGAPGALAPGALGDLFSGFSFGPGVAALSGSNASEPVAQIGSLTNYVGISGSYITERGFGAGMVAGFYSDADGMVGGFLNFSEEAGMPGRSLQIVKGYSQSFAGNSITSSYGASIFGLGYSRVTSYSPSTGEVTGRQWGAGLDLGPPVSGSVGLSSTTPTEFTSLYLIYIQIFNSINCQCSP